MTLWIQVGCKGHVGVRGVMCRRQFFYTRLRRNGPPHKPKPTRLILLVELFIAPSFDKAIPLALIAVIAENVSEFIADASTLQFQSFDYFPTPL